MSFANRQPFIADVTKGAIACGLRARFRPPPAFGAPLHATRPVRLGDSSPGGRLRFDGLARYLQDVSNDDTRDAAFENDMAWVVRRTAIEVRSGARFGEELTLTTFASGVGSQLGRAARHAQGIARRGDRGGELVGAPHGRRAAEVAAR